MSLFRRLLRPLPASILVAAGLVGSVWAANVSLIPGPVGVPEIQGTLNALINSMNAAFGTAGGASLNQVIYAPTVTSPVNLLSVTAGATLVAPQLAPGGSGSDANIGIVLSGAGSGSACLGGTTCANSSLSAVTVASAVARVNITGGATGVAPIVAALGETNLGLALNGAGTGAVLLGGTTTTNAPLQVAHGTANVTNVLLTGGNTGVSPTIAAAGETNLDLTLTPAGTGQVNVGNSTTCTGTTTATCSAQRFIVSVTGLSTAAGAEAAAMTVTNTKVAATDVVICNVNIYAGTGNPIATRVTPGSGTVAITILNVATSGSLNATVPIACVVL